MTPPAGFEPIRDGRTALWVRTEVRHWLEPILRRAPFGSVGDAAQPLPGGRGGASLLSVAGNAVVLRACRRGGLPARLMRDTYFGLHPRPFRELTVTEAMHRRRVPVVPVYGAAAYWILPGCYRGWIVTPYVHGARTLWEWVQTQPPAAQREAIFVQLGRALRCMHDCGGHHPDLNLHNILVCPANGQLEVRLIDFDRAWVRGGRDTAQSDLARLRRSARKLDPQARWIADSDLRILAAAYDDAAPPADYREAQ